jgi:DNA-directed RNA polymerase subunit M/transcription elongation factor TFIIS
MLGTEMPSEQAQGLEEALFEALCGTGKEGSVQFWEMYHTRVCHLIDTFRKPAPRGNPVLRDMFLRGDKTATEILQMSAFERLHDQWTALDEEARKRRELQDTFKSRLQTTDAYLCHRCKKRRCVTVQIQKRSADEPMTTLITCVECGNEWSVTN